MNDIFVNKDGFEKMGADIIDIIEQLSLFTHVVDCLQDPKTAPRSYYYSVAKWLDSCSVTFQKMANQLDNVALVLLSLDDIGELKTVLNDKYLNEAETLNQSKAKNLFQKTKKSNQNIPKNYRQ